MLNPEPETEATAPQDSKKKPTARKSRPTPRRAPAKPPAKKPSEMRLRLVGGTFEPHVVVDDGLLEPVNIPPMQITAKEFPDFPRKFFELLAQKEAELNNPAVPEGESE